MITSNNIAIIAEGQDPTTKSRGKDKLTRRRATKYADDAKTRMASSTPQLTEQNSIGSDKEQPRLRNRSLSQIRRGLAIVRTATTTIGMTTGVVGTFTNNDQITNSLENGIGVATKVAGLVYDIATGNWLSIVLNTANTALDIAKNSLNMSKQNLASTVEVSRTINRLGYSEAGYSR